MKTKLPLIFPFFLLLFTSCQQDQILKEGPAINQLKTGQKFCIILPEIHSDGATWQISDGYNTQLVSREKEVWHGPDKGIYFHLQAQKPGETNLHFIKRKFTDTIDSKDFKLNISDLR